MLPPLFGVAVKVTLPPEQIEEDDALIETVGVTELVVIVITLLVAVDVVTQAALEVMITLTWSPFANEPEAKVAELMPTFDPFICH